MWKFTRLIFFFVFTGCLMIPKSTHHQNDVMDVPEWVGFNPAELHPIPEVFPQPSTLAFGQSWLESSARNFPGGTVQLGWQGNRLYYFAQLEDQEVYTTATEQNQRLWELGDVLEIFVGIYGQPGYLEYHTAPNGLTLQLYFADAEALAASSGPEGFKRCVREDPASSSLVFQRANGWEVLGWISAESLGLPPGSDLAGQVLDISFGRYDYSRNEESPVLSSTSDLSKLSFHRRAEWRTVRLVSEPAN